MKKVRKKTINHVADTIFWYVIYFLPVILYLLFILAEPSNTTSVINFSTFLDNVGIGFVADNIISSTLVSIFGVGGILPLLSTNVPFEIFTWFISMFIIHLAVDFVLFIPRIAHKWLKGFYKEDE